jgi:hypothetical protein
MTTSITRPAPAGPDLSIKRSGGRRQIGALIGLGLLALAIAAAISWTGLQATRHAASGAVSRGATGSGFVPGGSVYDEQVPAAGRSVNVYGPGSPYAQGGSVYDEQVPAAGRWVNPYGPGSPYAAGGSVYDEQVPAAARAGTT